MEEEVKENRRGLGVEYDFCIYSGRRFIWSTLEVFTYSVRLAYVSRYGRNVLDWNNWGDLSDMLRPWTISWEIYIFLMECSSR